MMWSSKIKMIIWVPNTWCCLYLLWIFWCRYCCPSINVRVCLCIEKLLMKLRLKFISP